MHRAWLLALILLVACSDDDAGPAPAGSGAGSGGTGGDAAVGGTGGDRDAGGAGGGGGTGGNDAGAGTGGSAGSGGTGGDDAGAGTGGNDAGAGTGGSAGVPAELDECEDDTDCKVVGDCCSCVAVPSDASGPALCDATCAEDRCAQLGVSAVCASGRCVFDATCDDSEVTCERLTPECAPGQQAIVQGDCWGGCVDVRDCLTVKSCDACSADQACVAPGIYGPQSGLQCWDVQPACDGKPTCECMGNSICESIQCGDNSDRPDDPVDIGCFCVVC